MRGRYRADVAFGSLIGEGEANACVPLLVDATQVLVLAVLLRLNVEAAIRQPDLGGVIAFDVGGASRLGRRRDGRLPRDSNQRATRPLKGRRASA